ncbi:MAG: hypothetical protein WDM92_15165 [Caulobacteraceae bacterium]
MSSTYAYVGKFLKGFSGVVVEGLQAAHGQMAGYALFFVGAGAIGIPALVLCVWLAAMQPRRAPSGFPPPTRHRREARTKKSLGPRLRGDERQDAEPYASTRARTS